ncbi:alpha/beta hydrolase [Amycolatopsis benzoatilytica]|uniref:alpha/beta hydrolase n=1 Tax=Amycolatopsis benzoatilytica TaxID=346045 RepID=UPI000376DECC|nr:alpha/beta hydrolase [Amycolatopsis benzoatilytica]
MGRIDPQIAQLYAELAASGRAAPPAPLEKGNAAQLRQLCEAAMASAAPPPPNGVSARTCAVPTSDGASIEVRWYTRDSGSAPEGAAVVYFHGGGMIAGRLDAFDGLVRQYVGKTGVPFAVPDYRLAPESSGTRLAEDGFDTVRWVRDQAGRFGIDPARLAVMGDSGGGGVAAGTAILARDRSVPLARQLLVYPMLDDRNTVADPLLAPYATWDWDRNWTCWRAVLGDDFGTDRVPPAAAPARLRDFAGLAPAYVEVGELDIFRDEAIDYAQRLLRAGVPCELHVLEGVVHGHDLLSLDIDVSRRSIADRCRVIGSL